MMKIKSVFLCMATATMVMVGCSKSEIEGTTATDSNEITLGSSVMTINPVSRVAYEGTDLSANPLTALVIASNTAKNYTTTGVRCEGTMTFGGSNVVYNKPVTRGDFSLPGTLMTSVYLTGVHPGKDTSGKSAWDTETEDGKALLTITGKEDVMFAPEVTTSRGDIADGNYAELRFTHKLTLLKLSFSGNQDATDATTKITGVELVQVQSANIPATVTVDLSANPQTVGFSGNATSLACYNKESDNMAFSDGSYTVTNTPVEKAYIIAPPVTASAVVSESDNSPTYEYTFKVYYTVEENNTTSEIKNIEAKVDLKDSSAAAYTATTAGKAFNIRLQFVGGQIQATASVTNWDVVGNVDLDI